MARMEFSGTEELMAALFAETERLERKATEMLGEAGKVAVKAWQDAIEAADHGKPGKSGRSTGEMSKNVRASAVKKNRDEYLSSIYPHGRDSKRQSYAEIAFVLHYGSSKIEGDHFVDDAESRMSDAVTEVMQRVWDQD